MCRFAFKDEDARIDTELMLISTHEEYNVRFLWSARLKWYKIITNGHGLFTF